MGNVFLGKLWHWALIVITTALLWFFGSQRLHVIEFNWFIIAMLIGTAASVLAIVFFHKDGERVTREPLVHRETDTETAGLSRE